MKKLILASNSSRRQDILRKAGYSFSVHIAEIDENKYMKGELSAEDTVALLSRLKGEAAVKEITGEYVLLSADTIVVHENRIIGKPESPEDAFHILKSLCSKCHKVYTAVTIFNVDHENIDVIPILDSSDVYMGDLSDGEIISYINTKEPMDKAGAYGIQGLAGLFVDKIEGDFYNVEGLPLRKVYKELKKLGIYPHAISDQYAY
ncbi:Maf family protein [Anaeropeptidivorans aminofermentans]|jgi:septum formation protein|uniref:Maf family protein n=1 Tax=Anaeropeptidivorans aminofermentans TaxID=2934315 RepID=UPI0020243FFE|nr:Maf family protein [Anaeropeptidivorans aminofermentans]